MKKNQKSKIKNQKKKIDRKQKVTNQRTLKAKGRKSRIQRTKALIPEQINFEVAQFPYYHKNRQWFLAIILFAVIVITLAFWYQMWLLVAVIVLSVVVMFQNARKRPSKVAGYMNSREIKFGETVYSLHHFRSFWIVFEKKESWLFLRPVQRFSSFAQIPIPNKRLVKVHQKLLGIIPEERSLGDELISRVYKLFRF